MLTTHTLGVGGVTVDNTSLVLLVVILLSPFVAALKKIKIGEFEAEIEPAEVRKLAEEAAKSVAQSPPPSLTPPAATVIAEAVKALAETDPVVALAKLRIELETRLRRLYQHSQPHQQSQPREEPTRRPPALAYILRNLVALEVFSAEFASALRDVIAISNRAIHGEDIRQVDAKQVIESGLNLLAVLDATVRNYVASHPVETTVIPHEELEALQASKYRLTTVVPYVENPERRTYLLTQEELDAFLDGYPEYAEFLVSLERVS